MVTGQIKGGLAGKILRVNLSNAKTWAEETEKYARKYIGGRAINSLILLNELDRKTKWSDPENLLIFGVGALVGTLTPSACRISIDTKNVYNNGKGSANAGGHFSAELKFAGFDHVVISGKSENPVYLFIHKGKVQLRDARFIWGKTTFETEDILKREHAPLRVKVASIGPAGENLVRGSGVFCDRAKVAGGSGVGCVMGDKKLKALVACGEGGSIRVAEPGRFFEAVDVALKKVRESPSSEIIKTITGAGRWSNLNNLNWDAFMGARNSQDDFWEIEKKAKMTNLENGFPRYRKRLSACFMCPIGCIPFNEINEGRYKGTKGEGFWSNTIISAAKMDITDPQGMIKFWVLANELGLDTDFATNVTSWAFECYQRGLITKKETDGLKLEWGNTDAVLELLKRVVNRQGIGDLLAQGAKEASQKLGQGSEQFAIHMKGQDSIEAYRIPKGWALAVSTSPVAGRHLRGATVGGGRFGPKNASFDFDTYEDQPKYVVWQSLTKEMEDMLGICIFVGTWGGAYVLEPLDYVALTNSVMGTKLTEDDFFMIARRSYNLEKAFNTLHTDFDRKDDYPPRRFMEEPVKSGPYKGYLCEKENWDRMLDQFYELQGWDKETSLQTRTCLIKLGMEDVAEKLERAGKLIDK